MKRSRRRAANRHVDRATPRRNRLTRQLAAYSVAACTGAIAAEDGRAEVIRIQLLGGGPVVVSAAPDGIDFDNFFLDIDGDAIDDFELQSYLGDVNIRGESSPLNGILREYSGFSALLVGAGELIDQYLGFNHGGFPSFATFDSFIGTRGYVGLEFDIPGGSTHYAYLDVAVNSAGNELTLYGGAYESLIGGGIEAGAIPEPHGLGLLAMGAIGVAAWRRRKS